MTVEPDKPSDAPIRIRYVESADSLIEAVEQLPPVPNQSYKISRWQIAMLIAVAVLLPVPVIMNPGRANWKALIIPGAMIVVISGLCLVLLFVVRSGGRLPLSRNYYRRSYRKQMGREQTEAVAEFGREALFVSGGGGVAVHLPWHTIHRIVERPKGLLIYESETLFRWFPKKAFASEADYAAAVELMRSKVSAFEQIP